MEYEGQICRSPMERSSFMLPIMVGCSYNRCKFCNLFKSLKYREIQIEQIENELLRVKNLGGLPKKIFLGDGSAFDSDISRLITVLSLIKTYFPACKEINTDATILGILKKSDEELKLLYNLGVRHLYIGIETGLDDVLKFMKKDHNIKEAEDALERIRRIGYFFDAHIMSGIAGKGRGIENAHALAKFFNKTHPSRIINFSMFLHEEVPLFKDIKNKKYTPADELSNLKEEECLVEELSSTKQNIEYESFHDYIEFRVRGKLPKDKDIMLESLKQKILFYSQKEPIYAIVSGECSTDTLKKENGKVVWTR